MDDIVKQLRKAHAAADQSKPFNTNPLGAVAWLHLPAILDRLESAEARDAEQRAEIEMLSNALRAIRKHQRIIAPNMMTTCERIAGDALAARARGG